MKKWLCLLMSFLLLAGCAAPAKSMTDGLRPNPVEPLEDLSQGARNAAEFGVQLLQNCQKDGENTLISPLSVMSALAMTANGAAGETKTQMEQVLGMDLDALNPWLYTVRKALAGDKLGMANGIWLRNDPGLEIRGDFLQTNLDYFDAQISTGAFDEYTVNTVNAWVKKATGGMVDRILEKLREDDQVVLVNAMGFEADWAEPYQESSRMEGMFRTEENLGKRTEFLSSVEYTYLEDESATGFLKRCRGGDFAFAGILPREGTTLESYVTSLTGEKLQKLLDSAKSRAVAVQLPRFETGFHTELRSALEAMGMTGAFSADADFSGMGTSDRGNLRIGQVLHSTVFRLDEQGTKAGAATSVLMEATGACPEYGVTLDRPFVYAIVDCRTNLPVFLGILRDPHPEDPGRELPDHPHSFAPEPETIPDAPQGYCGNIRTTVRLPQKSVTLEGTPSVELTALCESLAYDPDRACRCDKEFEIVTESGMVYECNLTEGFLRCEKGQADLTVGQAETIRTILEPLQ